MIRFIRQKDLSPDFQGIQLIDVREPGEYRSERLAGSVNMPLSSLEESAARLSKEKPVAIVCRSGQRSQDAARRLEAAGFRDVHVVEGGLLSCTGLETGAASVWAMERQVRMTAGVLVLLGGALAYLLHPAFWLLTLGVGAGLVFSAATNTCGMARALARLPWNR